MDSQTPWERLTPEERAAAYEAQAQAEAIRRRQRLESLRRRQRRRRLLVFGGAGALLCVLIGLTAWALTRLYGGPAPDGVDISKIHYPAWIDQQILAIDGEARSGDPLAAVRDIAVHYVGNPGTSAQNNRNYFAKPGVEVSSHFVIGLEGEIIQCIPLDEKSAATNQRNIDTISIEVCHPDESGQFNAKTYASLIKLCAWLCEQFRLDETHLIRHYDVTGKSCPLYYVRHADAWETIKADVGAALRDNR